MPSRNNKKVAALVAVIACALVKKKKKRRLWVRAWIERRNEGRGVLSLLQNELRLEDPASYRNFLRMNEVTFEKLLRLVEHKITKQDTNMRQAISARSRLQVTLRFLATGETFKSLSFATRIAIGSISEIIPETCREIYSALKNDYIKVPNTEYEWHEIARDFQQKWNFPNCLGALDGKHIVFAAPISSGSLYYNYKGTKSIVLLALVDAYYRFIYIDIGANGRASDGGVYRNSSLHAAMHNNELNIPYPRNLSGSEIEVPYVMVADDAFPLSCRIMKPFRYKGLTREQKIFNYRLSRARCVVENSFGIMANVFRVLLNKIILSVDKVETIVQATCALHNFLITENKETYMPANSIDEENTQEGFMNLGMWRDDQPMRRIGQQSGNRTGQRPLNIRNHFMNYFNGVGNVPWQDRCVNNYRY